MVFQRLVQVISDIRQYCSSSLCKFFVNQNLILFSQNIKRENALRHGAGGILSCFSLPKYGVWVCTGAPHKYGVRGCYASAGASASASALASA